MLTEMDAFYQDFGQEVLDILAFEKAKFTNPKTRYAWQVRERFSGKFVENGLALAKERQEKALDKKELL